MACEERQAHAGFLSTPGNIGTILKQGCAGVLDLAGNARQGIGQGEARGTLYVLLRNEMGHGP